MKRRNSIQSIANYRVAPSKSAFEQSLKSPIPPTQKPLETFWLLEDPLTGEKFDPPSMQEAA